MKKLVHPDSSSDSAFIAEATLAKEADLLEKEALAKAGSQNQNKITPLPLFIKNSLAMGFFIFEIPIFFEKFKTESRIEKMGEMR